LWDYLGGAALDAPALNLIGLMGTDAVLIETEPAAIAALTEVYSDAAGGDGTIGFDIKTAPMPLYARPHQPVKLRKDGGTSTHQPAEDDPADSDPHRASIMTVQVYGGGRRVFVFPAKLAHVLWDGGLLNHRLVMHDAGFELRFLQFAKLGRPAFECTMQAAGLMLGVHRRSLADASSAYLGLDVPKDLRTSDWAAPELSPGQIAHAAADAVLAWRLWQLLSPDLVSNGRWNAYELQRDVIPAVVDMELRGLGIDLDEHTRQADEWARELADARQEYVRLTGKSPPSKPAEVRDWLRSVLPTCELAAWPTTEKGGELSTRRSDLLRAAHIPATRPLLDIMAKEKLLSSFGASLRDKVNPATGRLHACYNIAAAKSGRFTASDPNLQQLPAGRAPKFKRCFVPAPGFVLIGCDWSQIEMRAAAWIARDPVLTQVYADGDDLHAMNAAAISGCAVGSVTKEMRQAAKAVGFGSLYGMSATGLVAAAWSGYGVEMSPVDAQQALDRFFARYSTLNRWRKQNADSCKRMGRITIGSGRVVENGWEPGGIRFTQCCNLPVQGACADAMMLALIIVHDEMRLAALRGGLVAAVHDEILIEVIESDAARASGILCNAMIRAFAAMFPDAPTKGVAVANVGKSWAETK
jgi:DNA polymerase I-like protein with 3'-5' exonuclease and polymerase domains